jgi:phage gp36-like protein
VPPITVYATEQDLEVFGLGGRVLEDENVSEDLITEQLEAASREADGYIGSQYALPLEAIGVDLRKFVSWIAAFNIMSAIGYSPEAGQDNLFERNYDRAIKWLKEVRGGLVAPSGMQGAAGAPTTTTGGQAAAAGPMVVSGSSRGFSTRGETAGVIFDLAGGPGGFRGD